jgi:hypothetical protein
MEDEYEPTSDLATAWARLVADRTRADLAQIEHDWLMHGEVFMLETADNQGRLVVPVDEVRGAFRSPNAPTLRRYWRAPPDPSEFLAEVHHLLNGLT